jgi:hypothetical protein
VCTDRGHRGNTHKRFRKKVCGWGGWGVCIHIYIFGSLGVIVVRVVRVLVGCDWGVAPSAVA